MDYEAMKAQLTGAHRAVFDRAQTYVLMSNMQQDYAADKMSELYDLLLTAQSSGKPAEFIAGKDTERFIRTYFSDYGWRDRLLAAAESASAVCWITMIWTLLDWLLTDAPRTSFFAFHTELSSVLTGVIGGILLSAAMRHFFRPIAMHTESAGSRTWTGILIALFLILVGMEAALLRERSLLIAGWVLLCISAAYLLGFYIIRWVCRWRKYGTLRDVRGEIYRDSYYTGLREQALERAIMEGMLKQYEHLAQKGKVTAADYADKLRADEQALMRGEIWFGAGICAVYAAAVGYTAVQSPLSDTLIFAGVLGILVYGIWRIYRSANRRNAAIRQRIFTACAESGQTMPDYLRKALGAD